MIACPYPDCEYSADEGYKIAIHFPQMHDGSLEEYGDIDTSRSDDFGEKISEARSGINPWDDIQHPNKGRNVSEEYGDEISETLTGRSLPEEQVEEIRERMMGNDYAVGYERTPEQKANLEKGRKYRSDAWKKSMSESMKGNNHGRRNCFFVDELGHEVDSNWEMDVAFLLQHNNIDYEIEPEYKRSEGRSYFPDFRVGDIVIEVKGWASEPAIEKAEEFMERHEETYVVVGDEMPCNYHFSWENREQLTEVLEK
jgi:hypothetical protein